MNIDQEITNNDTQHSEYIPVGELERSGAKKLPPTEITPLAGHILSIWGLSQEQIQVLREFTAKFRYDLCLEKIKRLCCTPAEVYQKGNEEYVNFPEFLDATGRLDGQCSDIAIQWIIKMYTSGIVDMINAALVDEGCRVSLIKSYGLSKTHFCLKDAIHVWNGIALVDPNMNIVSKIYVDAAFQKMMTPKESGYKETDDIYDIKKITTYKAADISIGKIEISEDGWESSISDSIVLGVSSDFKYSYAIKICRDIKTGRLVPILRRIESSGNHHSFLLNDQGDILYSTGALFTPEEQDEIYALLLEFEKLTFVEKQPTQEKMVWENKAL